MFSFPKNLLLNLGCVLGQLEPYTRENGANRFSIHLNWEQQPTLYDTIFYEGKGGGEGRGWLHTVQEGLCSKNLNTKENKCISKRENYLIYDPYLPSKPPAACVKS